VRRLLLRMRGGGSRGGCAYGGSLPERFPAASHPLPFGPGSAGQQAPQPDAGKRPLESSSLGALEMKSFKAGSKTHKR